MNHRKNTESPDDAAQVVLGKTMKRFAGKYKNNVYVRLDSFPAVSVVAVDWLWSPLIDRGCWCRCLCWRCRWRWRWRWRCWCWCCARWFSSFPIRCSGLRSFIRSVVRSFTQQYNYSRSLTRTRARAHARTHAHSVGISYPADRMTKLVYPVSGGMEDWGYAASWDTKYVSDCNEGTRYAPYPAAAQQQRRNNASLRVLNVLVRTRAVRACVRSCVRA